MKLSHATRWPLKVSPFLSSTSWGLADEGGQRGAPGVGLFGRAPGSIGSPLACPVRHVGALVGALLLIACAND